MPYVVNGQVVSQEAVRRERELLTRDPQWANITDDGERERRLSMAAECWAADKLLIEQAAAADSRPIDEASMAKALEQLTGQSGCRVSADDPAMRAYAEQQLRLQRVRRALVASAHQPSLEEVEAFYRASRENFKKPEMFRAAHIVKHVTAAQSEEQARAGIEVALAELDRGEAFAAVAMRHSDCKDKAGDLGQFPAGYMVPEFEDVLRALVAGGRSGIFTTPFGFHIAELREMIPAGPSSFEEVRESIERVLVFSSEHEAYLREIAVLRSQAEIRWVPAEQASAAAG